MTRTGFEPKTCQLKLQCSKHRHGSFDHADEQRQEKHYNPEKNIKTIQRDGTFAVRTSHTTAHSVLYSCSSITREYNKFVKLNYFEEPFN